MQRLGDLVRDAHAREIFFGIGVALLFGIQHGQRLGEVARGFVMVRDDEVQPEVTRVAGFFGRADSAVHADDESNPVRVEFVERVVVQSVAFLEAVGDVLVDVAAEGAQTLDQQRGGGDAVHVVIAIDGDPFAIRERGLDAIHGDAHVLHLERVGAEVRLGAQEGLSLRIGGDAAVEEDLPQDGRMGVERRVRFGGDAGLQEPAIFVGHRA
ncbi:MAG: hypothetical protein PGMFKBFP_02566 [Anaerolineales bacterium]|nr:hypothetical protein [Anaerolineales bacterium]